MTLDASATGGPAVVIAASGVVLHGVTIVGAPDVAIRIEPGLERVGVSEATILGPGGRAIEASACRGLTIDHTRIERPGSDLVYVEDREDVSITDNFMVIGDNDFTLVPGSESIDAGDDLGYDCEPDAPGLYLGAAPDLGAVESG